MTTTRHEYAVLGDTYLTIAAVVFGIIALALAFVLIRYRAGRNPERAPGGREKHTVLEVSYVVLLAVITTFLVTITFRALTKENGITTAAANARNGLHIDVLAAQWNWTFRYLGRPVVTVNPPAANGPTPLRVPVGRPILFTGHSLDVLHQFWVPDVRFKRQVWPDHVETWGMVFPKAGTFQGMCNWFCGLRHQDMRFNVIAMPPRQFDAWLAGRRARAAR